MVAAEAAKSAESHAFGEKEGTVGVLDGTLGLEKASVGGHANRRATYNTCSVTRVADALMV